MRSYLISVFLLSISNLALGLDIPPPHTNVYKRNAQMADLYDQNQRGTYVTEVVSVDEPGSVEIGKLE